MDWRRDLAAIVQQRRDFQFIAIAVVHREVGQRAFADGLGSLGQHHGQCRHALTMTAGIGGFFVDRQVDEADERFEQGFELTDQ